MLPLVGIYDVALVVVCFPFKADILIGHVPVAVVRPLNQIFDAVPQVEEDYERFLLLFAVDALVTLVIVTERSRLPDEHERVNRYRLETLEGDDVVIDCFHIIVGFIVKINLRSKTLSNN